MTSIIVPVYNAPGQLARCLGALRETIPPATRVVILDDASDAPGMRGMLDKLALDWEVHRWPRNVGFVESVNRGMDLAAGEDLIVLNSDTVPAGDWLVRIERCAGSGNDIASVTPWTNNGEIVSLPEFCHAGPVPEKPELWARACIQAGPAVYPELPTAVGFCMWLSRRAIETVGKFDAAAFGRGYGEENDWCMRASALGWRHLLCDDAFVAHEGGASFGPLGLAPGESAMASLLQKHPGYMQRIQAFVNDDPFSARREAIVTTYNSIAGNGVIQT